MTKHRQGPALPFAVLTLLAVGVPSAVSLVFADQVTQSPWGAATIALVYEVALFVLAFFGKVLRGLEKRWVDSFVDWIDSRTRQLLHHERKNFLDYLVRQHQIVDMKGLVTQGVYPLELEHVFVQLSVVPQPPHKATSNPIQDLPQILAQGTHSIWEYLRSSQVSLRHLAILGPPGSGKTTLLKHILLVLATGSHRRHRLRVPKALPILLSLSRQATAIAANPDYTLLEAVENTFPDVRVSPDWLRTQLKLGRCLVLLDGLDEIADPAALRATAEWIERQKAAFGPNRFLVTSRPHGFRDNPLPSFTVLAVHPFNQDQIKEFIQKWYLANAIAGKPEDKPVDRANVDRQAGSLLTRFENTPSLMALAVNPLLLTMIATVHHYRGALPERRVELYAEICEVFLGRRRKAKGLEPVLSPEEKQAILQPMAFWMMENERREISLEEALDLVQTSLCGDPRTTTEEFLRDVINESGLLIDGENQRLRFIHLTFQEFLASAHCRVQEMHSYLALRVHQEWWHETIRLFCAKTNADKIVQTCLWAENISEASIILAVDCLEESQEPLLHLQESLRQLLEDESNSQDPKRQRTIGSARLGIRLKKMRQPRSAALVDSSLITCVEYQLFLEEQRTKRINLIPDHWIGVRYPFGHGSRPVTGVRFRDASLFCQWLSGREGGAAQYRLPQENELYPLDGETSPTVGYWRVSRIPNAKISWPASRSIPSVDQDFIRSMFAFDWAFDLPTPQTDLFEESKERELRVFSGEKAQRLRSELSGLRIPLFELGLDRAVARSIPTISNLTDSLQRQIKNSRGPFWVSDSLDTVRELFRALGRDPEKDLGQLNLSEGSERVAKSLIQGLEICLIITQQFSIEIATARSVANILSLNLGRECGRALDLVRNPKLQIDDIISEGLRTAKEREVDLEISGTHFLALFPKRPKEPKGSVSLLRVLDLLITRRDDTLNKPDQDYRANSFLRWYCRSALILIISSLQVNLKPEIILDLEVRHGSVNLRTLNHRAVELLVDLILIELRSRGQISAMEAIRIVKQPRGSGEKPFHGG